MLHLGRLQDQWLPRFVRQWVWKRWDDLGPLLHDYG